MPLLCQWYGLLEPQNPCHSLAILDKALRFVLDLPMRPNMHRRKVSRHADR